MIIHNSLNYTLKLLNRLYMNHTLITGDIAKNLEEKTNTGKESLLTKGNCPDYLSSVILVLQREREGYRKMSFTH